MHFDLHSLWYIYICDHSIWHLRRTVHYKRLALQAEDYRTLSDLQAATMKYSTSFLLVVASGLLLKTQGMLKSCFIGVFTVTFACISLNIIVCSVVFIVFLKLT